VPIASLVNLLIVGWLPGAVLFRLPYADRNKRASLDADERLFWAVLLSVALSSSIVVLLAALGRYTFERLIAADLVIAAAGLIASRFRLRLGAAARPAGPAALVAVVLVGIGLYRFFPPAEYVIGGKDPGVYVSEGIQIAQRGTFVYEDPVVASVPVFARDLFFPSHQRDDYYSVRFMGFWIRNPDTGAVIGQFPHLFPASIAIGYGLDGLTGARRAIGVWAILGVLAVYICGRRVFGRAAALAAAVLLSLNVLEVWFARYPNAELVMQALLFAALLATARAHVDDDPFFAPVAGALLSLLLFVRFDAVLAIAAVVASLALARFTGAIRLRTSFFVTLLAVGALAAWYLLGPMRAYMWLPIVFVSNLRLWQYAALVGGAALVLGLLALGARQPRLSARVRTVAPDVIAGLVAIAALYALYVREPAGLLAAHDAYALRTFTSYYFTLPALFAALIGFAIFARRAFWRAPELFTTVAFFAFFFFYKIRIVPQHFWMARRFLPIVLPGALLFACAAALGGTRGGLAPARLLRSAIGLAFVALVAAHYARSARPILDHVEYAGLIPRLEEIAGRVGDRDLLLVETRTDAADTHVLAMPLADIYARNVLVLSTPKPDKAVVAAFLAWARTKYERVLYIGGGGTDLVSPAWDVRPLASERFTVPEYDSPVDAYPRFVRTKEFDYSLYELAPPAAGGAPASLDLDVGTNDDLYVVRFHSKEQTEGRSIRWSRDRSYVASPTLPATAREVVLTMNDGGRPPAAPRAVVTISLAGQVLGAVTVDTGFKDYRVAIPPELVQRLAATRQSVELTLETTVWKPLEVLGTPDPRSLGVMVDRVAIK
jgi:hypothetical protein